MKWDLKRLQLWLGTPRDLTFNWGWESTGILKNRRKIILTLWSWWENSIFHITLCVMLHYRYWGLCEWCSDTNTFGLPKGPMVLGQMNEFQIFKLKSPVIPCASKPGAQTGHRAPAASSVQFPGVCIAHHTDLSPGCFPTPWPCVSAPVAPGTFTF